MKKFVILATCLLALAGSLLAQGRTLTFTSVTDAKFFVYLNGRLQNEQSSGMVTLRDLDDKEYHVRIVIDDPYEVAATKRIRPDAGGCEYTVRFNAVRERVYLKKSNSRSGRDSESTWTGDSQSPSQTEPSQPTTPRKRTTIRHNTFDDTASRHMVNSLNIKIEN